MKTPSLSLRSIALKQFLDANSCALIMKDGRYNGRREWQPYGCMMHNYTQMDTKKCFRLYHFVGCYNNFLFIGDSRLFELYAAFLKTINNNAVFKHNKSQSYTDSYLGLQVEYIYNPFLLGSFGHNITRWRNSDYPTILILGFGISEKPSIKAKDYLTRLKQFKQNLTQLKPIFNTLVVKNVKVIWTLQEPVKHNGVHMHGKNINNTIIDLYNSAAIEILKLSKVDLLISNRKLSAPFLDDMKDGFILQSEHIAKRTGSQILLNIYCNDKMNFQDGSCCSSAEPYTYLQIVTFVVLFLCFLLAVIAILHEKHNKWPKPMTQVKSGQSPSQFTIVFLALAKLALIMGYFYMCDRTNFFMKETKQFSHSAFWIPAVYLLCVGLFFTEDSGQFKVLHRDQTDEWKGWMQLVLLIYHWTDAGKVLFLFLLSRVILSTYVFLSGYGHFFYFWHSGDGSLVRFIRVLFRLNFMQFVLCLCMNRPYQSYEFLPLISFWFVLMTLFFVVPPRITGLTSENHPIQYMYLVFKFVFFFGIVTTLYMSEVLFEKIFVTRPWKALFVTTDDDITLWWRSWKRERYGVLCGMIFSAIVILAQRFNFLDDTNHTNLFSNGISLFATLISFVGIGLYLTFALLCHDVTECTEIHSYATFLPIIGYIVLRNVSGVLRSRHSTFFAWFGRISPELCLSQFHIWLAADMNGTLVLLPKYSNINLFLTSFIFVCASHEVHEITNTLLPYAVPANKFSLVRNVLFFAAIIVPIGVHAGMF
ncbi:hypothetical protein RUM43_013295 [Polyplax serrata]|uniref:Cas1p 10 TM acyl transferase domain-containing protein n=1 Tax=Polyplax serrata TaxID=468196 RepID=A0AAN8P0E2_POLSC